MARQITKVLHLIDTKHQLMCLVSEDGGIVSYFYEDHPVTEYYGQRLHKDNLELLDELAEDQFDVGVISGVTTKDWKRTPSAQEWLQDALIWLYVPAEHEFKVEVVHLVEGDTEYGLASEWLELNFKASTSVSYIPNHKLPWQIPTL